MKKTFLTNLKIKLNVKNPIVVNGEFLQPYTIESGIK